MEKIIDLVRQSAAVSRALRNGLRGVGPAHSAALMPAILSDETDPHIGLRPLDPSDGSRGGGGGGGGCTDIVNGRLLCSAHRHMLHASAFRLEMGRGFSLLLAPPSFNAQQCWRASAALVH